MRDDEFAFGLGVLLGFFAGLFIGWVATNSGDAIHKKSVQSMQKAAIERGAAEWKDEDGKPVFTWKEISK